MSPPAPAPRPARSWRVVVAVVVGAGAGFIIGAGLYLLLDPWLEAQGGPLEEFQGLVFNLVPGLTVIGGGLGGWWGVRRR